MEQWRIIHTYWISPQKPGLPGFPYRCREILWSDELPPPEFVKQVKAQEAANQEEVEEAFGGKLILQTLKRVLIGRLVLRESWEYWEDLRPYASNASL